jgi:threonylcarbamoyladenosine tRNA methylthiotransferase MtaB
MATFFLENFGCRATDADAGTIRRSLIVEGFAAEHDPASADIVVLNTCTVTAAADSQAREAVRKIHRVNPAASIVVTGCYAQRAPEELAVLDGVACVVGNSHLAEIPGILRSLAPASVPPGSSSDFFPAHQLAPESMSLLRAPTKILTSDMFAHTADALVSGGDVATDRTRPILKIQDGCNNRCSYCVIPFVRGRSRSLPPDGVVDEVRTLVAGGAREIVLSGINLGAYGRDLAPRVELSSVVQRILNETSLERLRFSSIEPQDVTEAFVALTAPSDRIAPHFHIPLQSGSDRVLRAMHRWYRAEHYSERLSVIRRALPHAAIGADVIVGFPGESEPDFQATAEFIERQPFTYLHVFSFSARPGTEAENLGDRVPPSVIRERARCLRVMGQQKTAAFRAAEAGRIVRALTLARGDDNFTEALTGNYLKVRIAGRQAPNRWFEVKLATDADAVVDVSPCA